MVISKYLFKKIDRRLRIGFISSSGRNFTGVICLHHRGGGLRREVML